MEILIVDDEVQVRGLLADLIREAAPCPVAVHHAADGWEALNFCRSHPVDLVITDIKMPHMDGLELITRLREEAGEVRVAVLSAFDDFQYVRRAMRHGALDYIPKSDFSREDIALLLGRTLADLRMEDTQRESQFEADERLIRRQKAFARCQDRAREGELLELLGLDGHAVQVSAFQLDSPPGEELFRFQILRLADEVLGGQGLAGGAVFTAQGDYLLLHRRWEGDSLLQRERFHKLLSALDAALRQYLQLSLCHGCSLPREEAGGVGALCARAALTLRLQSYYRQPLVPGEEEQAGLVQGVLLGSLRRSLEGGGYQQGLRLLQSFVVTSHREHRHPDLIRQCLDAATGLLYEQLVLLDPHHRPRPQVAAVAARHAHARHQEELEDWVEAYCQEYRAAADEAQAISPVIRDAIAYIEENYARKLSLSQVAARVERNKTYLSQLFTKELGVSFHEFLEKQRMDQAVRLLTGSDESLDSIAAKTGFDNANYFSKVFRRVMEDSPTQYRKKHRHEQSAGN